MSNVNAKAALSLVALAIIMGLLLFATAGTVRYWQAWVYLAIFMAASLLITVSLMRRDPALLARRMKGGPTAEQRPAQRLIMLASSLGFIALLVVPALDFRFRWSVVPIGGVVVGDLLIAIGFYGIARVYRANTFTSATIEVVADQHVVSTGPYAIVRHPMYACALLYLIGTPLALRSYWGLFALAAMVPFIIWRLLDEERLLGQSLPGYAEYRQQVRHRLVPFVW